MTPREHLDDTLRAIQPVPAARLEQAWRHLDSLAKPRRSLGYLEVVAARLASILGPDRPRIEGKRICVFAGDHGVTAEGISAYPPSATGLMVQTIAGGGAAINALARRAGAEVEVIDLGMATDPGPDRGVLRRPVRRGAGNIARGPAMTLDEAIRAVSVGIDRAESAARDGITLLATGEMGIGNSTPAAALLAALLDLPAADLAGPGTGLDAEGVAHKARVIEQALAVNRARGADPLTALAGVGGLEIAGLCGLCLGGAARARPVAVDGLIASAGALAAMRLCPAVKDYLFFAHLSAEPGHRRFFEAEGVRPLVSLDLRLGEGTGAALALQLMDDALAVYAEMATLEQAGIRPGP